MFRHSYFSSRRGNRRLTGVLLLAAMTAGIGIYVSPRSSAEPGSPTPQSQQPGYAIAHPESGATIDRDRAEQLVGPTEKDRRVAIVVSQLMKYKHLSGRKLDDEIARRGLKGFLESLDPRKAYFLQSDVDQFIAKQDMIDDLLVRGDVRFAYEVFHRYIQRVDERAEMIQDLLKQPFDFTVDEQFVSDPDELTYPKTEAEARERWRKRLKFDVLNYMVMKKVDVEEATEKIRRRHHFAAIRFHQMNSDDLLELYLSALTASFDPHSSYMSQSRLENFRIIMGLQLEGIGASLQWEDGYTVVRKIIAGGAADKDGRLKVDDHIVAVGEGEEGEMVDVVEMRLDDVVQLIRGKMGTVVRLGVSPGGTGEMVTYAITREKIELKDSEARGTIIPLGKKADGNPLRIGVINLPSFYMDMDAARNGVEDYKSCTRDVKAILDRFNREKVDAVLMDLSKNGGGSLVEAVNLTGLFIDRGPVVQVKDPDGRVTPHLDRDTGMAWRGPLVVLISKFSASASEIFAGAIQDYQRGIIIGDKTTHGKGTVQQMFNVADYLAQEDGYGALKMTIQQFYLPGGASTQNRGVISDIELPSVLSHKPYGETDLDYALAFDTVKELSHTHYDRINPALVDALKKRSAERRGQSKDFKKVLENVSRYLERKNRKTIPLNEEKFRAEVAEYNQAKEEEDEAKELADPDDVIFERDFYNNEVLAVTHDYVQMLNGNQIAELAQPQPLSNN